MVLSLIQSESMNLSDTYAFTGTVTGAGDALPKGTIIPYAGVALPAGWLLCDGTQKTITGTYQNLYNALTSSGTVFPYGGNTNGSGAVGTSHFRLPDLNGRLIVGKAASATRLVGNEADKIRTVTALVNDVGNITNSTNIAVDNNSGTIEIGMYVSGSGFSGDIWVQHVTDQNNIILSSAISVDNNVTLTFGIKDNILGATGGNMNHVTTISELPDGYVFTNNVPGQRVDNYNNMNYNPLVPNYDNAYQEGDGTAHTNIQPSIILNYLINY